MYRQIWADVFINYNASLSSPAALKQLFSMGAGILLAKRASLTSKNFQRLVAVREKGKLRLLKRQEVAQDYFDDMTSSK